MTPEDARDQLVLLLQLAHAGESGAIRAYLGHRASLRRRDEREAVARILRDEIRHRDCVAGLLRELGAAPDPRRERKLNRVGRCIAFACAVGGWFAPMYGAGRLERDNVSEYEHAARLAMLAELDGMTDALLEMAEVEWDHEAWFRERAGSHVLARVARLWPPLPPRADIRNSFAAWLAGERRLERRAVPWVVR